VTSNFLKHVSCEACGSSDAGSLYDDGHMHCFACGATVQDYDDDGQLRLDTWAEPSKPFKPLMNTESVEYKALPDRGITRQTCESTRSSR
jgi:twinkle protein